MFPVAYTTVKNKVIFITTSGFAVAVASVSLRTRPNSAELQIGKKVKKVKVQ